MHTKSSAKFTLWCSRVLAALVIGLIFGIYPLLMWYQSFRPLGLQGAAAVLFGYYLCVPAVLYALFCMDKLLRSILAEQVFVTANVRCIRRICRCCAYVSVVCLAAGFFYQPLLFLSVIMAFLALVVSVVGSVMAAAVEIREENDLTV